MKRSFFIIFVIIFFLIAQKLQVSAENGCGGTDFCESTKIVGLDYCMLNTTTVPPTCSKFSGGTGTIDCTVTETDCYGYERNLVCHYNDQFDGCTESGSMKKVSCCSNAGGGGGGGGNCNGVYTLEYVCVDPDNCKIENAGRCDVNGNVWCAKTSCAACPATPPVIDPITTTATTATINWTATGGTTTKLYITTDSKNFNNNCAGANSCIFKGTAPASPYTITDLTPGVKYYVKVVNAYVQQSGHSCTTETTADFTTSCTLIAPPSLSMKIGDPSQALAVNLNPANTGLTVGFVATPSGIVDFSTNQGNAGNGYQTNITAIAAGPTTITSFAANPSCQAQTLVNITSNNAGAWWQTIGAGTMPVAQIPCGYRSNPM